MSKWSEFWKRVLGQDAYKQVKARAMESLRAALGGELRTWLAGRLRKAGLPAAEAQAISYEVVGRALAAVDKEQL